MAKTPRYKIINKAVELIKKNPDISKRAIHKALRTQFGKSLRDTEILTLKKEHTTYSDTLARKRETSLKKEGFLPEEIEFYVHKLKAPISQSGFIKIRRFRKTEVRKAIQSGILQKVIQNYIRDSYKSHGWIDEVGKIRPDVWNSQAFYQLERPIKEREPILINPTNYQQYKRVVRSGITPKDALDMAKVIPQNQWSKRMEQYRYLVSKFYTKDEAIRIITATFKDQNGKIILQGLDLTSEAWQAQLQDRINKVSNLIKEGQRKGLSLKEARKAAYKEISERFKRNPNEPWEFLKEYYKGLNKKSKIEKDYKYLIRQRETQRKKKQYKGR